MIEPQPHLDIECAGPRDLADRNPALDGTEEVRQFVNPDPAVPWDGNCGRSLVADEMDHLALDPYSPLRVPVELNRVSAFKLKVIPDSDKTR